MPTLDRYRKPGGFVQLLTLLETCGPNKQQKFLELIMIEDADWHSAVKDKLLTIDRMLAWPEQPLMELLVPQHDLTLAVLMHGLGPERKAKIMGLLPKSRHLRIEEEFQNKVPNVAEISSINAKLIESARQMITSHQLKVQEFDPTLFIPDDIEEKMGKPVKVSRNSDHPELSVVHSTTSNSPSPDVRNEKSSHLSTEIVDLQRRVLELQKENSSLKNELKVAHSKLEQIKKIA